MESDATTPTTANAPQNARSPDIVVADEARSLSDLIKTRPPVTSGTMAIPAEDFTLFYGRERDARRISLLNPTTEDMEHLSSTCTGATFGRDSEDVYDETYRKAGKLDVTDFCSRFDSVHSDRLARMWCEELLDGKDDNRRVRSELYKLNVYGPGSFFKAHQDTPRGPNMFGSLVVVFPTPHEGGALVLRSDNGEHQEEILDFSAWLKDTETPSVAYALFFGDVTHEVYEVTRGYRVSLTYNFYFDDEKTPSQTLRSLDGKPSHYQSIQSSLTRLLNSDAFLPNGGTLGFGLRHRYPLKDRTQSSQISAVLNVLKGSDAAVAHILSQQHGLDPKIVVVYDLETHVIMCDRAPIEVVAESDAHFGYNLVEYNNGRVIGINTERRPWGHEDSEELDRWEHIDAQERVWWITPMCALNKYQSSSVSFGNEPQLDFEYGDLCMIVRVGRPGSRKVIVKGPLMEKVPKAREWGDHWAVEEAQEEEQEEDEAEDVVEKDMEAQ